MSSDRRLQANRRNAQCSTGPRTPEGKARAALNAVRHGLLTRNSVIPEEDRAQFLALLAALHAEHQPVGPEETYLVEQIACAQRRMERLIRYEAGFFIYKMGEHRDWDRSAGRSNDAARPTPEERNCGQHTRLLGRTFRKHTQNDAFSPLARYQSAIQRTYYQALNTLLDLQDRRRAPGPSEPNSPRTGRRLEPCAPPLAAAAPPPAPSEPNFPGAGNPAPVRVRQD